MRISDWSSDVCSSDLLRSLPRSHFRHGAEREVDDPVGGVEIMVVVGGGDDGQPALAQERDPLPIEDLTEMRVLIGRPFDENPHWIVTEQRGDKAQTMTLAQYYSVPAEPRSVAEKGVTGE